MSNRAQRRRFRAALLCLPLLAASCAEVEEKKPERRERLSVGGEVFRVFCMRSAASAFPNDLEGTQFEPACEGKGDPPQSEPHFDALIARRKQIVDALDRVLADDLAVAQELVAVPIEDDEIRTFLASLLPLYDPPSLMPESTRAIADVLARVLDDNDETGKKALDVLARTTGRVGYRPLRLALGVIRPLLEYPHLDDFIATSLELVAKGGKAEKEYDELIHALSLELATYDPTPPAPDSTLTLARNLLLSKLEDLDEPPREPLYLVKRDGRGVATPKRIENQLPMPFMDTDGDNLADIDEFGRLKSMVSDVRVPAPFAVRDEAPNITRDEYGRALNVWVENPDLLFDHVNIQETLLAGLAREQTRLLKPKPGDRSTVEKLGRGIPALLGKNAKRQIAYGKARISYDGPDPATGPLFDLVHAVGSVVARPETSDLLRVLEIMLRDYEHESAELVDTLLKIDARADNHPEAQLWGIDGPGTPSRFWDDIIEIGRRMAQDRPGLIEDVMRSLLDEDEPGDEPPLPPKHGGAPDESNPPCPGVCAPAQGALLANWMRYRDWVTFSPSDINARARSAANCQGGKPYCEPVDYTKRDVGMNRSLFQRTLAMVHGLNGQRQCNKPNAYLRGVAPAIPIILPNGDLGPYEECVLFEVQDMVEIHVLATLNKARIKIKPGELNFLQGIACNDLLDLGCMGKTQEEKSGIKGFDDSPSPESLARFVFAPPNAFISGFVDPAQTRDGVPVDVWEPDALFPMEVIDPDAKPVGEPEHPGLTFLQAGRSLMKAFEKHEIRGPAPDASTVGPLLDGYLFGDLLSTLHMHWASRSDEPCNGPPQETCTQSLDPSAPFYSYQSNLRSYEPLIAEALGEEKLLEVLYRSTKALSQIKVGNVDGITIMARFVELMLKPDPALTYRNGEATAYTNLGDPVDYVSPLYLLLDALKGIDKAFESDEHKMRLAAWKEARSELVDAFLTIETGSDGKKRMEDRIGRAVALRVLRFVQDRIQAHKDAGDLEEWAQTLDDRLVETLDKPVLGAALRLLDKAWEDEKAGAEFTRLTKYLFEEEGPGFAVSLVAAGDLLQLLMDSVSIAPLLDLAAEAVAPGVTDAVDINGKAFATDKGIARKLTELQAAIARIDTKRPSTTAKLLRNLVADTMGDGSTPLEVLLDAIAEVERVDPTQPSDQPLNRDDLKAVLRSVHTFLTDQEHGLERLYAIIQHRMGDKAD